MQGLEELVNLPEQEKEELGVSATAHEIAQQPETWRGTRKIFKQHARHLREFLEAAGVTGLPGQQSTVVLTGAGTSDYIGQTLTLRLRTEWHCETLAVASTDLLANMADYLLPGRRYLMISFSRSDNPPEGVTVLTQTLEKYPDIFHLVVSCYELGRMAELARNRKNAYAAVLDDAVNDRGLAMTSSFSNMALFGQCLAHLWSEAAYDAVFEALAQTGEVFFPVAETTARDLAAENYKRVCGLDSGALTGVAEESTLKVLEMTAGKVKTMAESVLGLRHGPMAALDKETLLICFASSDARLQRYEADLLEELKPDSPSPRGVISRVVGEFRIYEKSK